MKKNKLLTSAEMAEKIRETMSQKEMAENIRKAGNEGK